MMIPVFWAMAWAGAVIATMRIMLAYLLIRAAVRFK